MDQRTLTALNESISHWEQNLAAETPYQASTSVEACSLCRLFYKLGCVGCPVSDKTGMSLCCNSPYQAAFSARYRWESYGSAVYRDAFREAAKAELAFLKSLLPVEQVSGIGEEGQEPQDAGEAG